MVSIKSLAVLVVAAGAQIAEAASSYTITSLTYYQPGGLDKRDPHMTFTFQKGTTSTYITCDTTWKAGSPPVSTGTYATCLDFNFDWAYKTGGQDRPQQAILIRSRPPPGTSGFTTIAETVKLGTAQIGYNCLDQGVCIYFNKVPIGANITVS